MVERTFAWFSRFRRLNREYELLPETSEAVFYVGMIHILLKTTTEIVTSPAGREIIVIRG